jgi:hypothetical protein
MTVVAMVPLIWAAYVSMPQFQAGYNRLGNWRQRDAIGIDLRQTPKPQDATAAADGSQRISDIKSVTPSASPSLEPEPAQSAKPVLPQGNNRKTDQARSSSEKVKPRPAEDESVTPSASLPLEPEPEQLTKSILPQGDDRKADQALPSSEKVKPRPAEDKSVTTSASPSLEPKPEQLTKPILPQGNDRKADQAPPSSEKVKPRPPDDVISTGSIAPNAKKKLHGRRSASERNAGNNKKTRASSKRAARHKHKIIDDAPRRDRSDRADFYVGDSCRRLEKFSDSRDGWMVGHRLGCW